MRLARVRVLYREPDTLALWGIPYEMRREVGQTPRHIVQGYEERLERWRRHLGRYAPWTPAPSDPRGEWLWLGQPGWWGTVSAEDRLVIEPWLARLRARDLIPGGACEFVQLTEADLAGE